MPLPPPPPGPPPQQQQANILPPPPPGPPGAVFGNAGGWQQSWARSRLPQTLPPPPPTINPNQATNQHLAYSATHLAQPRQLTHLRIPHPPVNDQPVLSATFIPGGDSFGPGVGIPPLEDSQSSGFSYGYNDGSRSAGSQTYADGFGDISGLQYAAANGNYQEQRREKETPPTPISKNPQLTLPLRGGVDPISPGPPTTTIANSQARNNGQGSDAPGVQRMNTSIPSVTSNGGSQEWMSQWTLDRVLAWLSASGFSKDWQEAFRGLNIQGSEFIELGRGANGRTHLQKMHQTILPFLAKVCTNSGTGWDQHRERGEGKRMRKLIQKISDNSSLPTPSTGAAFHKRRESAQFLPSASTEGTVDSSPNLPNTWSATPSTAGVEGSPGKAMPAKLVSGLGPRNSVEKRSATLPAHSSQGNTPNDPVPPETFHGHNRAEFSKNILHGLAKGRHSPHGSGDTGSGSQSAMGYRQFEGSPQSGSPALGHAAPVSATTASSSSPHGRAEHSKSNSTDSLLKTGFARGGIFGSTHGDNSITSRQDHRKNTTDSSRPSPLEGGRQYSNEATSATKEHGKGLLDFFKRKKQPDAQPSPEEPNLESPTSPAGVRQVPPSLAFPRPKTNGNDTSAAEWPGSAAAISDQEKSGIRGQVPAGSNILKRYIMVTPDQWNYRLIDVSDCDSADTLRNLICLELGIPDPEFAQIFLTETGQMEHEEPLNDTALINNRRTKSDRYGTLKFYVQSPATTNGTMLPPQSAGLGLTFPKTQPSPQFMSSLGKPVMDEQSYARLVSKAQNAPESPYTASRDNVSKGVDGLNQAIDMDRAGSQQSQAERDFALRKAAEDFKREAERKQRAYQESRQQKRDSPSTYTGAGIRGKGLVDFDSPRVSPFEEKKTDNLVPLRRAPNAPSESNTLSKVNSLTKKSGERIRLSGHSDQFKRTSDPILEETVDRGRRRGIAPTPSVSHGLGAALANVGKMVGTPAAVGSQGIESQSRPQRAMQSVDFGIEGPRGNSPGGSPRSPRYIWSKGNMMFKNPDFNEGEQEDNRQNIPALQLPKNRALEQGQKREPSPAISPASDSPPAWANKPDRKSYGPNFDFDEPNVPFAPSPMPAEDSDDDSADDLFAIPLSNRKTQKKPALTVKTKPPSQKDMSVRIKSPHSSGGTSGPSIRTPETDQSDSTGRSKSDTRPDSAIARSGDLRSPEQSKIGNRVGQRNNLATGRSPKRRDPKRDSFASDIWANRPPIEGVINHLDEFFPNIDLDQPYLEEGDDDQTTPSTVDPVPNEGAIGTLRERAAFGLDGIPLGLKIGNENDTLGSDESTLKAKDRDTVASVVAQRQMRKSVGLGRMKSIREVAKGRNELSRARSSVAGPAVQNNTSGITRRKSTKMFGANIVQIQPKPGNRLSTLDPIPQDEVPQEDAPRRQATFRIIRGQLIGKGTYGRVYLGMNATTGEFLAVKQVEVNQTHYDKDRVKDMVAALDQEIDTMQHLEHRNIVQYLGCERKEFSISIYLEYISGGSVGSCLRKHGKFEESVVRSLTRQTLEGLAYLHAEGILHRDLKADNILLDVDGTCRISDFGISKKTDNIYGNDVTNSMQGSVFWMAPEVIRSQGQGYSAKVDIWSLGCVVLEMFAGRRPWSREEAVGAIFKLGSLNEAPPIPDEVSAEATVDGVNFMYDCFQM